MNWRTVKFPEDFAVGSFGVDYCDEWLPPPSFNDLLDEELYRAEMQHARSLGIDDDIPYGGPAQGDVPVPTGFCLTLTLDCSELRNYQALARLGRSDIQFLNLRHQQLSSEGFRYVEHLSGLLKIDLGSSTVRDADLAVVGGLTDLEWLELSAATQVTDAGIAEFGQLTRLRGLNASLTWVAGQSLAQLTHLDRLLYLNLNHTPVDDRAIPAIERLRGLVSLGLASTKITDAGVEMIRGMTWLRSLALAGTALTDVGVKAIDGLTELRSLALGGTAITDASVPVLAEMRDLRILGITDTRVSFAGYNALRYALPLCSIMWNPPPWRLSGQD